MNIFIICFENGETKTFKRAVAENILARNAAHPQDVFNVVAYADGRAEVYCEEKDDIDGLGFTHCRGDIVFERMWEIADCTGSAVIWPSVGPCAAVTRPDLVAHLPPELREPGKDPFVVRTPRELMDAIELTG